MSVVDRLFPEPLPSVADLKARFPNRALADDAMVTRVGPSPTGFMHIGTLYTGRICAQFARRTGGVSILRIEDTDKKREVDGAVGFIIDAFDQFDVAFDEGADRNKTDRGAYGPYRQSHRGDIYQTFVRSLVEQGLAYPCFSTGDELNAMREQQKASSIRTGYYGKWALWRDRPEADVVAALDAGIPFVIRFRAPGNHETKLTFTDLIAGERDLPENDVDTVILKSDGLPTYHMAHVVDDHLMGVTHVIRGDEWFSSVPTHLQLFDALGFDRPHFAHIAPIMKMDGTSRRKLSKRKDPEATVGYFEELGYPSEAVMDYLLTLMDPEFETWRADNPDAASWDFELTMKGLQSSSGPLFDFDKLGSISRDVIAGLSSDAVYTRLLGWATTHDADLAGLMTSEKDKVTDILSIERGGPNARKDFAMWSGIKPDLAYFFDDRFDLSRETAQQMLDYLTPDELGRLVQEFLDSYDPSDDSATWFGKLKELGGKHGFALRPKDYKKNPDDYKGAVSDVAKIFRVLLTGRERSPDLYSVMQVMGPDQVARRCALVF